MNLLLLFCVIFFCQFVNFVPIYFLADPNPLGRTVSWLSCVFPVLAAGVHVPVGLNCDKMEPPHEEQHNQYLVERDLNAFRSMRDYRNPPWVSAPSYMVPSTNSPYGNAYNPSWGNHLNLSWGPKPP